MLPSDSANWLTKTCDATQCEVCYINYESGEVLAACSSPPRTRRSGQETVGHFLSQQIGKIIRERATSMNRIGLLYLAYFNEDVTSRSDLSLNGFKKNDFFKQQTGWSTKIIPAEYFMWSIRMAPTERDLILAYQTHALHVQCVAYNETLTNDDKSLLMELVPFAMIEIDLCAESLENCISIPFPVSIRNYVFQRK